MRYGAHVVPVFLAACYKIDRSNPVQLFSKHFLDCLNGRLANYLTVPGAYPETVLSMIDWLHYPAAIVFFLVFGRACPFNTYFFLENSQLFQRPWVLNTR